MDLTAMAKLSPMTLEAAVEEIVFSTKQRLAQDPTAFPFFLIVGAGISAPEIPLASGIEEHCRDLLRATARSIPDSTGSPLDRYEALLRAAFPQPDERRQLIEDLTAKARITPANFRLAHVIGEKKLTNLVFTTNFDELLARALRLLGYNVVTCEHPKTIQRIDPRRSALAQVVHVHGTHWSYDCCNLRGEIVGRAKADPKDTRTMSQLLIQVLADRSPIVVGYSGWKEDVIMTALRARLEDQTLRFNLYWFCYRAQEVRDLPKWLTDHPGFRLVVPSKAAIEEAAPALQGIVRSAASLLGEGLESAGEPSMPARSVFVKAPVPLHKTAYTLFDRGLWPKANRLI